MAQLSVDMFWAGMVATGLAALAYLAYTLGSRTTYRQAATSAGNISMLMPSLLPRWTGRLGTALTWLALGLLTASLAARVAAVHRPPYSNMWEYQVTFSWAILLFYLLFERWSGQRAVGALVLPVPLALLAVAAAFFSAKVQPLVPALQSNWVLALHVGTLVLAYGALAVSFGAGIVYLVQGPQRRFPRLPRASQMEELGYRSVLVGFPLLTLGIALGAYWGNLAWGRYWGWDPKETSALVTWLIYAGYLHARGLRAWRGSRSAWLLVLGFVAVLFTYFAVNLWVSGLHSYAGN